MIERRISRKRTNSAGTRPWPINLGLLPNLIGYNVRRAQIALWRDFNRSFGRGGIRPGIFTLMSLVQSNPGIAQFELAEALDIDKSAVVGLLHRLQRRQWLTRRLSTEDRRRQRVFLTPAGEKAIDRMREQMLEHEKRFVRVFTREELGQLFAYLRRIHP